MSSPEIEPGSGFFSISPLHNVPLDTQVQLHDYHEICLIENGSLAIEVDQQEYVFESPAICGIWSGQIHRVLKSENLSGYILTFRHNFFPYLEAENMGFFLYSLYQSCEKINHLALDQSNHKDLQLLFSSLYENYQGSKNNFGYREMLQVTLLQILIKMIRLGEDQVKDNNTKTRTLSSYYSFLELLEYNYSKENEVSFYASKLGMSSRNLNEILRKNAAKTFKEIMLEKKCYEAKKLIAFTSLNLKEIAYQLGFKSQSYFCYTFRKGAGLTPKQYRVKSINHSN